MDTAALKNQGMGYLRGTIWFAGGFAAGAGYIHGDTAIQIAGAVLLAIGGSATTIANTNSSIVQAASQVPDVKAMAIADPKLADKAKSADPATEIVVAPLPKET